MKIRQFLFLLGILASITFAKAQDQRYIDSLKILIANRNSEDTTTIKLLNKLAFETSYLNLDSGLFIAQRSYLLSKKLNYVYGMGGALNTMGTVYFDKADYKSAIESYTEARKILEKFKDDGLMIALYANLASTHMALKDFNNARHFIFEAKKLVESSKGSNAIYAIYSTLGDIYYGENKNDSAIFYYNITLSLKMPDKGYLSATHSSLGYCYKDLKKYDLSERSFLVGIKIAEEIKSDYYYYGNLYGLAEVYFLTGRSKEAEAAYLRSLKYFEENSLTSRVMEVSSGLYELYNAAKRYDKALFYHVKYAQIRDSINSSETNKIARELEKKYENEKKKAQIEKLNVEKTVSEAENERKGQLLVFAIIGCALVIIALGFAVFAFINKRKANIELQALHKEVNVQKNELFDKNKNITDSILYAQRIQRALLSSRAYIKENVNDFFIVYKPKDIVSGDFYWAQRSGDDFFFMLGDCTGHGVPGAFMSLLGISYLNELIIGRNLKDTNLIIDQLRQEIISALSDKDDTTYQMKDGMDAVFCKFNFLKLTLEYTAANNKIVVIRNNVAIDLRGDSMPVGRSPRDHEHFTKHEFALQKDDMVYMFTDGYPDQFGGPKGKKLKEKPLKELLCKFSHLTIAEQEKNLTSYFSEWKGSLEQIDDVCLVGIKI